MTGADPTDPPSASPVRSFLDDTRPPPPVADAPGRPGDPAASAVRPYVLTGGRADSGDLEIEAQVGTTPAGFHALSRHVYESHAIVELCLTPMAVAEVAARLHLHLGVARVLVGDLIVTGDLSVRRPDRRPHRNAQLIERVIRGLQANR
jgi:hypothetical protein